MGSQYDGYDVDAYSGQFKPAQECSQNRQEESSLVDSQTDEIDLAWEAIDWDAICDRMRRHVSAYKILPSRHTRRLVASL